MTRWCWPRSSAAAAWTWDTGPRPGRRADALAAWAQERGVTLLETAIGALAARPACSSVIAGATSAEQVKANTAAADWTPTEAELAEIDAIVPPPPMP